MYASREIDRFEITNGVHVNVSYVVVDGVIEELKVVNSETLVNQSLTAADYKLIDAAIKESRKRQNI